MPAKRKPRKAPTTKQKQSQRQSVVVNVHVPKPAARRRGKTSSGAQQKQLGANYVIVQPSLAVSNPIPQMYSPSQQADTSFPTSAPVASPAPVSTGVASVPISAPVPATPEPISRVFTRPADVPLSAIPRQRIEIGNYYDDSLSDIMSLDGSTLSVRDLEAQDILTAIPHVDNFIPEIRQTDRSKTTDDIPNRSFDLGAQIVSGKYGDDEIDFRVNNPMGYGNDLLSTYKTPGPRKQRSDAGMPRGPYRERKPKVTNDESFSQPFMDKVLGTKISK